MNPVYVASLKSSMTSSRNWSHNTKHTSSTTGSRLVVFDQRFVVGVELFSPNPLKCELFQNKVKEDWQGGLEELVLLPSLLYLSR